jgi:hypothetical protein
MDWFCVLACAKNEFRGTAQADKNDPSSVRNIGLRQLINQKNKRISVRDVVAVVCQFAIVRVQVAC